MESKIIYDEYKDESLDPRVQGELEKLNAFTAEINRLEANIEEANACFRASLSETSSQLQSLSKKLGSCVEKARPYHEAKERAKTLQMDCQKAAVQYQRANAVHQAARETISLAEDRFSHLTDQGDGYERKFDPAWQEMLNHATMKVMEAEVQKSASEREHMARASAYNNAESEVQEFVKKLKNTIAKSQPYYNLRISTQLQLEARKHEINNLQSAVTAAKRNYTMALRNLEQISEEIHEKRRANMRREPGVGAEWEESVDESISHKLNMDKDWQPILTVDEGKSPPRTQPLRFEQECESDKYLNITAIQTEMRESTIEGCDGSVSDNVYTPNLTPKDNEVGNEISSISNDSMNKRRESWIVNTDISMAHSDLTVEKLSEDTKCDSIPNSSPSSSAVSLKENTDLENEVIVDGGSIEDKSLDVDYLPDGLAMEGVVYESQSKPYFVFNQRKKFESN